MSRVIHFDIKAENPEKLIRFYKKVFNWDIVKSDEYQNYWIINTPETKRLTRKTESIPALKHLNSLVNTIDVHDIDKYLKKIVQYGGEILLEKMILPGIGSYAYCRDVEGTVFGIVQKEKTLK